MPNVTLLMPIADVLGITVTELLKGEKISENNSLNTDEVEKLVINSLDLSVRDTIRQRKKNWIYAFLIVEPHFISGKNKEKLQNKKANGWRVMPYSTA